VLHNYILTFGVSDVTTVMNDFCRTMLC